VVLSVLMFVYAMFGPAREQVPARVRAVTAPAE
jgi:nitric oxide reductase subunit B